MFPVPAAGGRREQQRNSRYVALAVLLAVAANFLLLFFFSLLSHPPALLRTRVPARIAAQTTRSNGGSPSRRQQSSCKKQHDTTALEGTASSFSRSSFRSRVVGGGGWQRAGATPENAAACTVRHDRPNVRWGRLVRYQEEEEHDGAVAAAAFEAALTVSRTQCDAVQIFHSRQTVAPTPRPARDRKVNTTPSRSTATSIRQSSRPFPVNRLCSIASEQYS